MEIKQKQDTLNLDTAVYSLEAIKNASYDFSDQAVTFIEILSPSKVCVRFEPSRGNKFKDETLTSVFLRLVLDHQVRIDVSTDYKLIREMIVAQAFEPVDNLEQVTNLVVP